MINGVVNGAKIKDIKTVRSHLQAIGQCSNMISENKLKPIISADTAGSAKFISKKKDKTDSAIASALAAKIYGLKIIKSKVLVVGAGGLGCPVVDYLSRAGVGNIGIIDHDQ